MKVHIVQNCARSILNSQNTIFEYPLEQLKSNTVVVATISIQSTQYRKLEWVGGKENSTRELDENRHFCHFLESDENCCLS